MEKLELVIQKSNLSLQGKINLIAPSLSNKEAQLLCIKIGMAALHNEKGKKKEILEGVLQTCRNFINKGATRQLLHLSNNSAYAEIGMEDATGVATAAYLSSIAADADFDDFNYPDLCEKDRETSISCVNLAIKAVAVNANKETVQNIEAIIIEFFKRRKIA